MAHRFHLVDKSKLTFSRVNHAPLSVDSTIIVLSPSSLLNAISTSYPEVKFISIGEVPDIQLDREEAVEE